MKQTLEDLHRQILEAIATLEQLVSAPAPDVYQLANARLGLTRANGQRRRILAGLYPKIELIAGPARDQVRALRADESASMEASAEHIGRWGDRPPPSGPV